MLCRNRQLIHKQRPNTEGAPGELGGWTRQSGGAGRSGRHVKGAESGKEPTKTYFLILYVILPRIGPTELLQMISEVWGKENAV